MSVDGSTPDISVVVPVHDAGAFLAVALDSIADQRFPTWHDPTGPTVETIVVDDGSTDGSARLGEHHAVVLLSQSCQGPAAARNTGVARSRGRFVAFLDADDFWTTGKLDHQIDRLHRCGGGISLGRQELVMDSRVREPAWVRDPPAWMPLSWRGHVRGQVPLSSMVLERDVFEQVGPFDEDLRLAEDVDWLLRAIDLGIGIDISTTVVLHRRIHIGNLSNDTDAMRRAMLEVLKKRVARTREHRHLPAARSRAVDRVEAGTGAAASVAVVIPVHNHQDLLREALASVRSQTLPPLQVIVVDDGSNELAGEPSVASVVAASGLQGVRVVRQRPSGAASARNLGAGLATASHLLFLDADDRLSVTAIERMMAALPSDHEETAVVGLVKEFSDGDAEGLREPRLARSRLLGSILFPRRLFRALGGLHESLSRGETIDLIHRATHSGMQVVETDDVVLDRRLHPANGGVGDDGRAYLEVARRAIQRSRSGPEVGG